MSSLNGNEIQNCWNSIVNRYRFTWLFSSDDDIQELGEQFTDLIFSHCMREQVNDNVVFRLFFRKEASIVEWRFSGIESNHMDVIFKGNNRMLTFNVFGFSASPLTLHVGLAETFLPLFQSVYREFRHLLKKNSNIL